MSLVRGILAMALSVSLSCATRPKLPPPTYEKSELPPWEAPSPPADPLDAAELSGDWVEDPGDSDQIGGRAPPDAVEDRASPSDDEAIVPSEERKSESSSSETVGGEEPEGASPPSPGPGGGREQPVPGP